MLCLVGKVGNASTCSSIGISSNYSSPLAWSCGRVPSPYYPGPDNVLIGHSLLQNGNLSLGNGQALSINHRAVFTVMGDLNLTNSAKLTLYSGTLEVHGDLEVKNGASLDLRGGTVIVHGKLKTGGSSSLITIAQGVTIEVLMEVLIQNSNAVMINSGTIRTDYFEISGGNSNTVVNHGLIEVDGDMKVKTLIDNKGTLRVKRDLMTQGNGQIRSEGLLDVTRDLIIQNSSSLYVTADEAIVGRDFENSGNSNSYIDGNMTVANDIENKGSSYICGLGTISWENNLSNTGSSSFCNDVTPYSSPWSLGARGPAMPLPVKLSSFSGQATGRGNDLRWTSVSEENFSHYDLEKAQGRDEFKKLASIVGNGGPGQTANYNFFDVHADGQCYYRLRSIDLDASQEFSNVIQIKTDMESDPLVYPTSVSQNHFTVEGQPANSTVTMVGLDGREIPLSPDGHNGFRFSQVKSGIYVIIIRGDMRSWKKKVLVNQ